MQRREVLRKFDVKRDMKRSIECYKSVMAWVYNPLVSGPERPEMNEEELSCTCI